MTCHVTAVRSTSEATGSRRWRPTPSRVAASAAPSAGWLTGLRSAGALVAVGGLLLAVWFGAFESASSTGGAVRWVDSGGRPVMVLDEPGESGVTIIWVLDDTVEGAAREVRSGVA